MREEQFRAAIGDASLPLPHPRAAVYRNNVAAALTGALRVRYPVTEQLVGTAFFFHMAQGFANRHRPRSPVLIDYGAEFPGFIRGYEPARHVPYLGDVAQLESLWWLAYHAAEAEPLPATALAGLAPETLETLKLQLHPSVGLIASAYATGSVWEAHHGGPAMGQFDIGQPQHLLVARPHAEVQVRVVASAEYRFLSALQRGLALPDAVDETLAEDPGFDIAAQLAGLFTLGLITGLSS